MSQHPEDPRPDSVPPPGGGGSPGYGPSGFSAPVAAMGASGRDALASRWLRLGAAIIDGVIVGVASVGIGLVVGAAGTQVPYVLYWAISLLYAPLLLMRQGSTNGQTVGKQAVGIRVVHESGEPMTFGRAALREIVGKTILSAVTCGLYGIVDALWCLWDPRRQCLHDKVGSTFVVVASADARAGATLR